MRWEKTYTFELDYPPSVVVKYEAVILGEDVNPPRGYVGPDIREHTIVGVTPLEYVLTWSNRETVLTGDDAERHAPQLDYSIGGADEARILLACGLV